MRGQLARWIDFNPCGGGWTGCVGFLLLGPAWALDALRCRTWRWACPLRASCMPAVARARRRLHRIEEQTPRLPADSQRRHQFPRLRMPDGNASIRTCPECMQPRNGQALGQERQHSLPGQFACAVSLEAILPFLMFCQGFSLPVMRWGGWRDEASVSRVRAPSAGLCSTYL